MQKKRAWLFALFSLDAALALTWATLYYGPQIALARHEVQVDPALPYTLEDLVGNYARSDGFSSEHLELKKDGTFITVSSGCVGGSPERDGTWAMQRDLIRLRLNVPPRNVKAGGIRMVVPIRWGNYMYLADEINVGRMIKNHEESGSGSKPILGDELCKQLNPKANDPRPDPPPFLPARYKSLYEQGP